MLSSLFHLLPTLISTKATELFCSDGDGKIGSVGKIKGYRYSGDMFTVGNCLIAPSGDKIHAGEPWGPIADFRLYPFQMSQNGEDYWPEDMKLKPPVDDVSALIEDDCEWNDAIASAHILYTRINTHATSCIRS